MLLNQESKAFYGQCDRVVNVCLTADGFHGPSPMTDGFHGPDSTLWVGRSVLPSDKIQETASPFLCCDSLMGSIALMQVCHTGGTPSLLLLSSTIIWARQQKAGMVPVLRGWDCYSCHWPSSLLKAWDKPRGHPLLGHICFLLHLNQRLGWAWFGWKLVQHLVPYISWGISFWLIPV